MTILRNMQDLLNKRDPDQQEFHQAVKEVVESIIPVIERNPVYKNEKILERIIEPERVIQFRVPWSDDDGNIHVNILLRDEKRETDDPAQQACAGRRVAPVMAHRPLAQFPATIELLAVALAVGIVVGGIDLG